MGLDRSPPVRWFVPTLTLAVFVNFLGALALGPFLPVVASELGVSVSLLGQVPALMMLLAALLGLVIGPLADRFGYRRTLLFGLLAVLVSNLATGLAPSFLILLLAALVGAIGRAAVLPVAQAIVGTRFADDAARRAALSQLQSGQSGAAILGIPMLTTIAALLQWRAAFFALAALALLMSLALARLLAPEAPPAVGPMRLRSMLAPYGPLVRDRPSLALILADWLGNAGLWVVLAYLGAYYVQRHGFTTQQVGWAYLVGGLGVLAGQLLAGGRLGAWPRPLVIGGRIVAGCLMGAALLLPFPSLVTVTVLTVGMLANGASNVGAVSLLSAVAPTERATALALNGSAVSLGAALGGAVGGLLLAVGGYSTLGWGSFGLALVAAVVVWWSPGREVLPQASVGRAVE